MKRQSGFTIIELVVVIALLGILSAVALPRFINVADDARAAAVSGAAGGLGAGVALVRAQAIVDNAAEGTTVEIDGIFIVVNANGYPIGSSSAAITTAPASVPALDAAACVSVWESVLQSSAPTVATAAGKDYLASASTTSCNYAYQRGGTQSITYNTANGQVTIN